MVKCSNERELLKTSLVIMIVKERLDGIYREYILIKLESLTFKQVHVQYFITKCTIVIFEYKIFARFVFIEIREKRQVIEYI